VNPAVLSLLDARLVVADKRAPFRSGAALFHPGPDAHFKDGQVKADAQFLAFFASFPPFVL